LYLPKASGLREFVRLDYGEYSLLEIARKSDVNLSAGTRTATVTARKQQRPAEHVSSNGNGSRAKHLHSADPLQVNHQTKVPVITGEAHYKGMIPVDGILLGQLGNNGGSLGIRQKTHHGSSPSQPELSGEITFRDVVRVNGHIAGTVYSKNGTLIVDSGAAVDANVEVAIAVIRGTVTGDIVAQQRIEIARGAKVFGNIWTRSISVEVGATFDGVCTMIEDR
jgi:hypothetical protein